MEPKLTLPQARRHLLIFANSVRQERGLPMLQNLPPDSHVRRDHEGRARSCPLAKALPDGTMVGICTVSLPDQPYIDLPDSIADAIMVVDYHHQRKLYEKGIRSAPPQYVPIFIEDPTK